MRRRRVLSAAGVAVIAMSVAGCTTMMNGVLGVQRLDGHLFAYVQMCDGHSIDSLHMFERSGPFKDDWKFPAAVQQGTLDLGVYADTVTLIDTGNPFCIGASRSGFDGDFANGPDFTSDDLAELGDGEILAMDAAGDSEYKRWTEGTFGVMVNRFCEQYWE